MKPPRRTCGPARPWTWLPLLALLCACAPMGPGPGQAGTGHAPAPPPPGERVRQGEPPLDWTLPPGCRLARQGQEGPEARWHMTCAPASARMDVRVRRLASPMDTPELRQALVRVETERLRQAGAGQVAPPQSRSLDGRSAEVIAFTQDGLSQWLVLVNQGPWLYRITLAPVEGPGAELAQAAWRGLGLDPRPDPVAPASPSPAPQAAAPAEVRGLVDNFDPPSLARARALLERAPDSPQARTWRLEAAALEALALRRHGRTPPGRDWNTLVEQAQAGLRTGPETAEAWRALGLAQILAQRPADAETSLEKALQSQPNQARNHWALALWNSFDRRRQESLARRALELEPSLTGAGLVLADSLVNQNRPQQAAEELQRLWRRQPDNTSVLLELARLQMDRPEQAGEAMANLRRLLALDPADTTARFNLALLLLESKQAPAALAEIEKVLEASPADAGALSLQGDVLAAQGEHARAAEVFERAGRQDPRCAACFYKLGAICATQLKDRSRARRAFERFLDVEPQGEKSDRVRQWLNRQ